MLLFRWRRRRAVEPRCDSRQALIDTSLRAKRSNPDAPKKEWIASSLSLLAMTAGPHKQRQPGTFINSSGTAASYLELCSTRDVLTLRTCGAAVRFATKS